MLCSRIEGFALIVSIVLLQGAIFFDAGGDGEPLMAAADIPVTACQALNSPGTYVLLNDVSLSDGSNCFTFGSDDITLDCNGHSITGTAPGYIDHAFLHTGPNRITIRECVVEGAEYASWGYGERISYIDNEVRNNRRGGFIINSGVGYSDYAVLRGNKIISTWRTSSGSRGTEVIGNHAIIEGNFFYNNTWTGIGGTPCWGSYGSAIYASGINATIRGNNMTGNGCGMTLQAFQGTVESNFIEGATAYPTDWGVSPIDSHMNETVFSNNYVSGSMIVNGVGNRILSNFIRAYFALQISGMENYAYGNAVDGNLDLGGSRSLLGGNIVSGDIRLSGNDSIVENNSMERLILDHSAGITNITAVANRMQTFYAGNMNSSTISSNNLSGGFEGVYVIGGENNTICGNRISNETGFGLVLQLKNSVICSNWVSGNAGGISHLGSGFDGNLVYNNFFNNSQNVEGVPLEKSNWSVPKIPGTNIIGGSYIAGNFWSDYNGTDTDGDGIGDTLLPYTGGMRFKGDFAPLVRPISCGDVNGVGGITSADIIYLVNYVFRGGPAPVPGAGDVNGDGNITSADIIYLVNYVFRGGPAPICPIP